MRRASFQVALLGPLMGMALLGAACSGSTSPATAAGVPLLPSSPTSLPTFDLQRFDRMLGQLHGKPVVVNVWASWCGPCISEAPAMAQVARTFAGRIQFVGVDVQDQLGTARAFIHKYGWRFPSVFDPTGAIRDGLGFVGQPVTQVIDASGKQVEVWSGPTATATALEHSLQSLVGQS